MSCSFASVNSAHRVSPRREFGPAADPLSLLRQRKWAKKGDPAGSVSLRETALRCSVFAARAELATRPAGAALKQLREECSRGRCAPAAKPCAAQRAPRGLSANTKANARAHTSLRIGVRAHGKAQRAEWHSWPSMCTEGAMCLSVSRPRPVALLHAQMNERLCFGYFHLARQMKVTRPPGRIPGADSRSEQAQPKRANATAPSRSEKPQPVSPP
jgi:hypothetical protein